MRKLQRLCALAFLGGILAAPAEADKLAPYWEAARAKWNAVGDKAAAGDGDALARLGATVNVCALDEVCAKGPSPLSPPSQPQIDAAAAAINIGWLFKEGKVGEADPERAMEHYRFAEQMGYPVGAYNVATMLQTGGFAIDGPQQIETLYMTAAYSGSVSAAIALGKMNERMGYPGDAAKYYVLALQKNPSQRERETAEAKLAAIGLSPEEIAEAVAHKLPGDRAGAPAQK